MRALVWFRADLRTVDNRALAQAARDAGASGSVVGVFTICPEQWRAHDWGVPRAGWTLRNLASLRDKLASLNIPLKIVTTPRFEGVPDALLSLAKRVMADALYLNREYEVNELSRDEAVTDLFEGSGIHVHAFHDQVVVPPDAVRTGQGSYYTVFSPYRRAWEKHLDENRELAEIDKEPRPCSDAGIASDDVPTSLDGYDLAPELDGPRAKLWKPGQDAAIARLKSFRGDRLKDYKNDRDFPAIDGTSVISPYLAVGAVSPRQCLAAARTQKGPGPTHWESELVWREFYRHVLVGYPRVCRNRAFRVETDRMDWEDASANLDAWKQGRTGIPIVDAGIRQLLETGWMHNRVRMIVAMFLTKNLLIDWREGERCFMNRLIDADFASNNGGWQWSASTGTDAAPYFRIFNPASQSRKFDPDGAYIRRFIPELKTLDNDSIHEPWEAGLARGVIDYPDPIVDLKSSRTRAIERFKRVLGSGVTYEEAPPEVDAPRSRTRKR
ncbi:MAG: deoxyribodipyrimidine photo-lyase [Phycisphaerales bacterium]|jgi:deoxyribodipyrimidine photo-lyase|nr:deoxyribodipyrimidine photo-lyase [Phycisphaerales bacterium]